MGRYLRQEDRARCLTAGLLLRAVFGAEKYGRITEDTYGKPQLPGEDFFNLSHSGEYVVLAAASCEVGVDIEQVVPCPELAVSQCLTAAERQWLAGQTCSSAFFRLWTGKESVMKAEGLGFRMSPESIQVLPVSNGVHSVAGKSWFLYWCSLPGYVICTASAEKQPVRLLRLDWDELLRRQIKL